MTEETKESEKKEEAMEGTDREMTELESKLFAIKNEKDPFVAKRLKKELWLYDKFTITRNDGTDKKGGKHENADYFVLDLTNDKFAVNALIAYEQACRQNSWFTLADDLVEKIRQLREPQATEDAK